VRPQNGDAAVWVDRADHPDEPFRRYNGRLGLDPDARPNGQRSRVLLTNVRDAKRFRRHETPLQLTAEA